MYIICFYCDFYSEKEEIVDFCGKIKGTFKDTVHLIFQTSSMKSVPSCSCFIYSQGVFGIKINDIRLPRKKDENCSDSEIQINSKNLRCESAIEKDAFLLIKTNAAALRTKWLIIEPKGIPFLLFVFKLSVINLTTISIKSILSCTTMLWVDKNT